MPNVGDPAPLFSGTDVLTNQTFSLADHGGKCVLVAFHGYTWCGPCTFAAPLLQEVWGEYEQLPVQFVVVSVNENPSPAALQQAGFTMPWLTDPSIPALYEVGAGVPKYFFLDASLTIVRIQSGLFSSDAEGQKAGVRGAIDACLEPSHLREPYWAAVALLIFGGVIWGGGGVVITPGGKPIPVPPGDPMRHLPVEKRDALIGLAASELARRISDPVSRRDLERSGLKALDAAVKRLLVKAGVAP
jgi:peroxiredoxin